MCNTRTHILNSIENNWLLCALIGCVSSWITYSPENRYNELFIWMQWSQNHIISRLFSFFFEYAAFVCSLLILLNRFEWITGFKLTELETDINCSFKRLIYTNVTIEAQQFKWSVNSLKVNSIVFSLFETLTNSLSFFCRVESDWKAATCISQVNCTKSDCISIVSKFYRRRVGVKQ